MGQLLLAFAHEKWMASLRSPWRSQPAFARFIRHCEALKEPRQSIMAR